MGDFKSKLKRINGKKSKEFSSSLINPSVALVKESHSLNDYEDQNYRLIFKYYNHSQCELKLVKDFKPLIKEFDSITKSNWKTLRVRDTLNETGDYKNLFNGLSGDVRVEEIDFTDIGRIIFFRVKNYFCLISVLAKHRRN